MRQRTEMALGKIKKHGWARELMEECSSPEERIRRLTELLPETKDYPMIVRHQLIFQIHFNFKIDLGVCQYYLVDDRAQYCNIEGYKRSCSCLLPQKLCVLRDQKKCTNCLEWRTCTKIQLDYEKRRKFNETQAFPTPELFLIFMAKECESFSIGS